MSTGIVQHECFLRHDTGPNHPERSVRLLAVSDALHKAGLTERLTALDFKAASLCAIEAIHSRAYMDRVVSACADGELFIDVPDSAICVESFKVARLAAGAVLAACDAVMNRSVTNAFCAVRPPGHHAERDRSMGFCLFNNVAIAAEYLIRHHHLARVAIVDFDVHHGNGTQHVFEQRQDVLFISVHEAPQYLYPGTGYSYECGVGEGKGFTLNVPLPPGCGDDQYRQAFTDSVIPKLDQFKPQVIIISAGFDASCGDPLAHMDVTPQGFAWMTRQIREIAMRHAEGRIVSSLEGGYNLRSLAAGVVAHVETLLE